MRALSFFMDMPYTVTNIRTVLFTTVRNIYSVTYINCTYIRKNFYDQRLFAKECVPNIIFDSVLWPQPHKPQKEYLVRGLRYFAAVLFSSKPFPPLATHSQ
jgi:hypothetical protein